MPRKAAGPASSLRARHGGDDERGVPLEQLQVAGAERAQALDGAAAPGPSGGVPRSSASWNSRLVGLRAARARGRRGRRSAGRRVPVPTCASRAISCIDTWSMPRHGDEVARDLQDALAVARRVGALDARWPGPATAGARGHGDIMPARSAPPPRAPGPRAGSSRRSPSSGSSSAPFSANAASAMPTGSSLSSTWAPMSLSILRISACAQTAPNRPVERADDQHRLALAGRCRGTAARPSRSRSSARPGCEALYSGVAMTTRRLRSIASKNSCTGPG